MMVGTNFIDGAATHTDAHLPVHDPSTGKQIGEIPASTASDVERAVAAAVAAREEWAELSHVARGAVLLRAAEVLAGRSEEIARLASREMGKPIGEMRGEVSRGVNILRYYGAEGWHDIGDVIPATDARTLQYTLRVPMGVAALITPWNFPVAIPLWKMAPAIVYGNTVVWKPAEWSSLTAAALMNVWGEAGLPRGVVNLVCGEGSVAGSALVDHPNVDAISFTGSTAVGAVVRERATSRGAKVQTEMGGKNAVLVCADADLSLAVEVTVSGAMRSAGQKCTATSRLVVERAVLEPFRNMLVERVRSLVVGSPDDEGTYVGPLAHRRQRDRVLSFIEQGKQQGARLLCGGNVPAGRSDGAYVEPTVFDGVTGEMIIAQEEIFGPVVGIMAVDSFEEGIQIVNGTRFGLSASVFTRDLQKAMTFVKRAQVGMVRVNAETAGVELQAPFGGMKGSSSHTREQGRAARDFYTQVKTAAITM